MFLPHPRVKVSIVGSLRDREVACSASDRQGSNFESCVWRTVSSQSSHHPQEVLLAQFSLYVHKSGLKPDSFHFIWVLMSWLLCNTHNGEIIHSIVVSNRIFLMFLHSLVKLPSYFSITFLSEGSLFLTRWSFWSKSSCCYFLVRQRSNLPCPTPANTKHLYNIWTKSTQRLRRWSNNVQMLFKCCVFAGIAEYFQILFFQDKILTLASLTVDKSFTSFELIIVIYQYAPFTHVRTCKCGCIWFNPVSDLYLLADWLTLQPPNYSIWIFTHLKLCLADAIPNFKCVKITAMCLIWDETIANVVV